MTRGPLLIAGGRCLCVDWTWRDASATADVMLSTQHSLQERCHCLRKLCNPHTIAGTTNRDCSIPRAILYTEHAGKQGLSIITFSTLPCASVRVFPPPRVESLGVEGNPCMHEELNNVFMTQSCSVP